MTPSIWWMNGTGNQLVIKTTLFDMNNLNNVTRGLHT